MIIRKKMNILLLSHRLDYSGAPIALLRLAETLVNQGHSITLVTFSKGPLGDEFKKLGAQQFNPSLAKNYDLYFANTFLTVPAALNTAPNSGRVAAWIHESRDFFQLYGFDEKKYGLSDLKHAFFPSNYMLEEYRDLMPNCKLEQLRNLVTMDDVKRNPDYQEHFSVTGTWEPRKNQATLIKLINQKKIDIKLNFIGAQKPKDIAFSQHIFVGQVPISRAKELIASSYGLISASLSETQNLAAIESILSNNPVLLSDIPAHRELKSLIPEIVLFNPNDPTSFIRGLEEVTCQKGDDGLLHKNRGIADKFFGRYAFGQKVQSLIAQMEQ
jgi:glycosyltransferase involved in cell wall biosynthesis